VQQPQVQGPQVQQLQVKQQTGSGDVPTMQIPDPTPQYQEQSGGGLGGGILGDLLGGLLGGGRR